MKIVKAADYKQMSKMAALVIAGQILSKPDSVLGFATGGTPVGTYTELVRLYQDSMLDFSQVTTFNLDEYYGCDASDPNSYVHFMEENLFKHVNLPRDQYHLPNGMAVDLPAECAEYERQIDEAGGLDLQLLGIGHNGHIGFNEPDDHFSVATHLVHLTPITIDANARFYDSREQVPTSALSMGIGTIMRARHILLIASGKDKREIMQQALYGPVTPRVPASVLQLHHNVTVITALDD